MFDPPIRSRQAWQQSGAYCFLEAFGCPDSRSRFDSIAGGTNGKMTADVMSVPAMTDCSLVAGLGACAEKWRIAVCVRVLVTAPARLMVADGVGSLQCCR